MIRLFSRYWLAAAVTSLGVEAILLLASFGCAHRLRSWVFFGSSDSDLTIYTPMELWIRAGTFAVVTLLMLYVNGLYDFKERPVAREVGIKLIRSLLLATAALWGLYFLIPEIAPGRAVFALGFGLAFVCLALWRLLLVWLVDRKFFSERILIVGSDEAAKTLAREILSRSHLGYRVIGFLSDDENLQGVSLVNPRVIGTTTKACELALEHQATRVVVAQTDNRGKVSLDSLLRCKTNGVPVSRGSTYYEQLTGKVMLDGPRVKSWLVFSSGFIVSHSVRIVKRSFDFLVGSLALLVSVPLLAVTALLIKLDSRGPVFYQQERVGQKGTLFSLWKFRTMRPDAEQPGVPKWAEENDPRVTRAGRFLRGSRLDELPQLWNVVRGDMSLVGPRPERKQFVDQLIEQYPLYEERLAVRPGLTGWAQIRAPYAASFEESVEKLRYDLYYIKNLSFLLDISILASTLRIILLGRGAR